MSIKALLSVVDDPCCCKACICLCSGRQAGRPAVRMQQLAGAQAQECCVCCLNSGLSQCRPGGAEGRKLLHVYIAELSFGPPQCLMHFCSNIHKCADDPHWCPRSQPCLHPASALHLNVCLWTMKQWKTDSRYFLPLLWAFAALTWRLGWEIKCIARLNSSHWDVREGQQEEMYGQMKR